MSKPEDDRARRLAEALRQNLRRRKAQARETVQERVGEAKPNSAAEG